MRDVKQASDPLGERLVKRAGQLTPALRRVAEYIIAHRESATEMSAAELGAAIGTSDATVIRAVQALGFAGFRELKREIASSRGHGSTPVDNLLRTLVTVDSAETAIEEVIAGHIETVTRLGANGRAEIRDAITVLAQSARIGFYGIGPTAALAQYAHAMFARNGRSGVLLQASGSGMADDLLQLDGVNAVFMLAYGEAYPEAEATISEAQRLEIPIVLISDSLSNRLAREAKVVVPVPRGRAGNIALHGATLVCIEAVLLGVIAQDPARAIATLQKLNNLRHAVRGRRKPG